jgi:hypothetical protein
LAKQIAQLLWRMRSRPLTLPREGCHADGDNGE